MLIPICSLIVLFVRRHLREFLILITVLKLFFSLNKHANIQTHRSSKKLETEREKNKRENCEFRFSFSHRSPSFQSAVHLSFDGIHVYISCGGVPRRRRPGHIRTERAIASCCSRGVASALISKISGISRIGESEPGRLPGVQGWSSCAGLRRGFCCAARGGGRRWEPTAGDGCVLG